MCSRSITVFSNYQRDDVTYLISNMSQFAATLIFLFLYFITFLYIVSTCISFITQIFVGKIKSDWGTAESSQYHIQTDEGPERFFRYQTDSGQFRNEKRLKDGTVIGKYVLYFIS